MGGENVVKMKSYIRIPREGGEDYWKET